MKDKRWIYLWQHIVPSVLKWPILFFRSPIFATKILHQKSFFFAHRNIPSEITDPNGMIIDTAMVLNSYWNIVIEQGLSSKIWVEPFKSEKHPFVVDIGANAGVFSYYLTLLNSRVKILAIEPLPEMAGRLSQFLEVQRKSDILINRCACSDREGKKKLHYSCSGDTKATLEDDMNRGSSNITVDIKQLDSMTKYVNDIFLIKIDTEGHEVSVLKGAKNSLEKTRFIIAEAHDLNALGKIETSLGSCWEAKRLDPSNYLFTNTKYQISIP